HPPARSSDRRTLPGRLSHPALRREMARQTHGTTRIACPYGDPHSPVADALFAALDRPVLTPPGTLCAGKRFAAPWGRKTMQPRKSYLICATPRSGSYLLCELLALTGVAGKPTEYLSQSYER